MNQQTPLKHYSPYLDNSKTPEPKSYISNSRNASNAGTSFGSIQPALKTYENDVGPGTYNLP